VVGRFLRLEVVVRLRREIALWRWRRERARPRPLRFLPDQRREERAWVFEARRPQRPATPRTERT